MIVHTKFVRIWKIKNFGIHAFLYLRTFELDELDVLLTLSLTETKQNVFEYVVLWDILQNRV